MHTRPPSKYQLFTPAKMKHVQLLAAWLGHTQKITNVNKSQKRKCTETAIYMQIFVATENCRSRPTSPSSHNRLLIFNFHLIVSLCFRNLFTKQQKKILVMYLGVK